MMIFDELILSSFIFCIILLPEAFYIYGERIILINRDFTCLVRLFSLIIIIITYFTTNTNCTQLEMTLYNFPTIGGLYPWVEWILTRIIFNVPVLNALVIPDHCYKVLKFISDLLNLVFLSLSSSTK